MKRLVLVILLTVPLLVTLDAQGVDLVNKLYDSYQHGQVCYSYGGDAGRIDGDCTKNGEAMYAIGSVAGGLATPTGMIQATTPWPGCNTAPKGAQNPPSDPVKDILNFLGLTNPPTAVANCVTPTVPFPSGRKITRIDLTVIVNSKDAGLCGPEFHVDGNNQVILPKGGQLHKCGAMFGRGINTPFDNCAFSTPVIVNNKVSAVFANWAGDLRVGVIRVYYK